LPPVAILQIQNPNGLFRNDFIFRVTREAEAVAELKRSIDQPHVGLRDALAKVIAKGDLNKTKKRRGSADVIGPIGPRFFASSL
jgi:hypothetical protein